MSSSLRPAPYTSAVSRNVTPASADAVSTSIASASDTSPQASPPSCQQPSPTSDTQASPNTRCFMKPLRASRGVHPHGTKTVGVNPTARQRRESRPSEKAGQQKRRDDDERDA